MKRYKNLTIIVLMTIFLLILSGKAEATTGKINTETARLREEPNTTSTILEQLNENDEVEILEEEDNWYKVKANVNGQKITGYVSAKLVDAEKTTSTTVKDNTTDNKTTETTPEVTTNTEPEKEEPLTDIDVSDDIKENKEYDLQQEAEVKILPIMSSNTKCKLSGKVKTVTILNDWCKIECDKSCGWIRTNVLKKIVKMEEDATENTVEEQPVSNQETSNSNDTTETSASTTNDTTSENSTNNSNNTTSVKELNKTGYVKVEGLTVRKGPSTSTEAINGLSKNDKVDIIGETDGWYQIKLKGEVGYVSAKYISDTKVTETTSRSGSTIRNAEEQEKTEEVEETNTETVSSSTGISGAEVVEYAKQYLGYKYVAGGSSPSIGFDCSGFTTYVYKHFGISLNRSSKGQIKNGVAVSKNNLQPGDILIFNGSSNTSIGHVGIYVGGNDFIHAANSREGVIITSLSSSYYQKRYVGARRVI